MSNWLKVRFTNATETIIRAVKDKSIKKYTFNRGYPKCSGIGKIGFNVWALPISGKKGVKTSLHPEAYGAFKEVYLERRGT